MLMNFINTNLDMFLKIIVAAALGAVIGFERDIHGRSAGIRTNLLVSVGSCLFVIMSWKIAEAAHLFGNNTVDPTRIAAQVVTGIGFLGAGTIIREGFTVKGLTTAACLWVVAAVGMACGYGYFQIAGITTVVAIISLLVLQKFENILKKYTYRILTISTDNKTNVSKIVNAINNKNIRIDYYDFEKNYKSDNMIVKLFMNINTKGTIDNYFNIVINILENEKININYVKWDHKD